MPDTSSINSVSRGTWKVNIMNYRLINRTLYMFSTLYSFCFFSSTLYAIQAVPCLPWSRMIWQILFQTSRFSLIMKCFIKLSSMLTLGKSLHCLLSISFSRHLATMKLTANNASILYKAHIC